MPATVGLRETGTQAWEVNYLARSPGTGDRGDLG